MIEPCKQQIKCSMSQQLLVSRQGVTRIMMPRFSETLLDHARYPQNVGRNLNADYIGRADLCGQPPQIEIYLRCSDGIIVLASFHAAGCGVTTAVGSVLTTLLMGRTVETCLEIAVTDLTEALDGIPPDKMYCPVVALNAVRDAVTKSPLTKRDSHS